MVKLSAIKRRWTQFLQIRFATVVGICLLILTLTNTLFYGEYDYPAIPLTAMDRELHREVCPNLIRHKNKPQCNYEEVLNRSETIENWQVSDQIADFSPLGIENGSFTPTNCNAEISVAILVTYRDRQEQLNMLLPYIHNFLRKQNIHYKVFLIAQQDRKPWNKGMLYNLGAKYAISERFPCLILHDVDLLPLDAANLYACLSAGPRHMSASIDTMRFVLLYHYLVGGVLAIRTDHFIEINGFSNLYEDWGGEDDDLAFRLFDKGFKILRLPRTVSRYHMVTHAAAARNPHARYQVARGVRARVARGAGSAGNGLDSVAYRSLKVTPHRLFTMIAVQL